MTGKASLAIRSGGAAFHRGNFGGMASRAENLLREALELPDSERAEIAGALIDSLDPAAEAEVEQAWRAEVARRVADLDAGNVQAVPWDEARDRLFAGLKRRAR